MRYVAGSNALLSVALHVHWLLNLKYLPSAGQARVGGAKGMVRLMSIDLLTLATHTGLQFLVHPDRTENISEIPKLWCRPTQIKFRYGAERHAFVSCLARGGVQADALERILLAALTDS